MNNKILAAIVLVLSGLWMEQAHGGGMTSSGGELISNEHNPWFLGPKPVTYCIDLGDAFSQTMSTSRLVVSAALNDWSTHIQGAGPRPTGHVFADGQQKNITTSFKEVSCSSPHELTFLLGKKNKAVSEALEFHADFTVAVALREDYDESLGRVKRGVIWLASDYGAESYLGPRVTTEFWSHSHVFHNVLMHEMGHMFGVPHLPSAGFMSDFYPGAIVKSGAKQEASAKTLLRGDWITERDQRCGMTSHPGGSKVYETVFGVSKADGTMACIKSHKEDMTNWHLEISLLDGDQNVSAKGKIKIDRTNWQAGRIKFDDDVRIKGSYASSAPNQLPVHQVAAPHFFLIMASGFQAEGQIEVEGATYPVILQQSAKAMDPSDALGSHFPTILVTIVKPGPKGPFQRLLIQP